MTRAGARGVRPFPASAPTAWRQPHRAAAWWWYARRPAASAASAAATPYDATTASFSSSSALGRGGSTLRTGEIHVILGPMFAGKTTALLERVAQEEAKGMRVTLVKSCKDRRYSDDEIVSHDGASRRCNAVATLKDLRRVLGDEQWHAVDVIAVDEAQFMPDLVEFCAVAADEERKKIIVAGLNGDFERKRFGQVLDLLPHCDSVTKLTGVCAACEGRPALFSMRIAADDNAEQELVGGSDLYKPVCRLCYASRGAAAAAGAAAGARTGKRTAAAAGATRIARGRR